MATTVPAPVPTPVVPAPPATNWWDPTHVLTYVAIIVSALLGAGVFPSTSEPVKIMTIISIVLATLGYQAKSALVVRAHYAAIGRAAIVILMLGMFSGSLTACSSTAQVEANAVNCLKAEGTVIEKGFSIVQVVEDIGVAIEAVATGNFAAIYTAVEPFVLQYGEQFVACVIDDLPTTSVGSGSGAVTAKALTNGLTADVKVQLIQKLVGNKKLVHPANK